MTLTGSRRHTLIAGLALIALTNAIALGGVAYNRSGEPESVLKLTQRELWQPHGYGLDREEGGLQLSVRWRVLTADPAMAFYADHQGTPEWLDEAKLASLGFDVSQPPAARRASWRYDRQLPKEALVVLELDGPARQKALERARERAAKEAAKGAETGKTGPGTPAQEAAVFLKNEETANSRLFAVDAGPDAQALRAKYSDRTRYAIVQGKVRPYHQSGRGKEARWTGYIEVIENARVNVPLEFRKAVESAPRSIPMAGPTDGGPGFEVRVAFGKRFEPWITAASGGR
jgi:hypothetical protein